MPKRQRSEKHTRGARRTTGQRPVRDEAHLDRLLDAALAATFPASDPVSTLAPEEPPVDPKPSEKPPHSSST